MKESTRAKITTVVFDVGNVLVGWSAHLALADRMTEEQWNAQALAADFVALNALTDRGVAIAEVVQLASERDPAYGELLDAYYGRFPHSLSGPVPGMAEIVAELRAARVRLLGLSNWSAETFHHASLSAPAVGELEAVMVSGSEGLAKPDPEIFERMIDIYGLAPEQTVFIDDTAENVAAARAIGFISLLFTDTKSLREDLRGLGVLM